MLIFDRLLRLLGIKPLTETEPTSPETIRFQVYYWADMDACHLQGPYHTEDERDIAQQLLLRDKQLGGFYWMDVDDYPHGPFHSFEEAKEDEADWDGKLRTCFWWDGEFAPHGPYETMDECQQQAEIEVEVANAIERAVLS